MSDMPHNFFKELIFQSCISQSLCVQFLGPGCVFCALFLEDKIHFVWMYSFFFLKS